MGNNKCFINIYLKYCIKIEKTTIHFLSSTQKEYVCKKWLPFEIYLGHPWASCSRHGNSVLGLKYRPNDTNNYPRTLFAEQNFTPPI